MSGLCYCEDQGYVSVRVSVSVRVMLVSGLC